MNKLLFVFFIVVLLSLSACSNSNDKDLLPFTVESIPIENYTGWPDFVIQSYFVYANGSLYYSEYLTDDFVDIPEDFIYYGEVINQSYYVYPTEELYSAHVDEGSKVYINPDNELYIYVKFIYKNKESSEYSKMYLWPADKELPEISEEFVE